MEAGLVPLDAEPYVPVEKAHASLDNKTMEKSDKESLLNIVAGMLLVPHPKPESLPRVTRYAQ